MRRFSVSLMAILAMAATSASGQVFTSYVVDAKANIFGAGYGDAPDPGGGGGGFIVPCVIPDPGTGRILTFDSVTGLVSCCNDLVNAGNGADGGTFASGNTDISGFRSIAGVKHDNKTMFLMGMVTSGTPSGPTPATRDWTADSFFDVFVELNVPFFIGDGQTGLATSVNQRFHLPDGATDLWLGFADGFNFDGQPGFYNDNIGHLTASFRIRPGDPVVPEPGTIALLAGAGVAASVLLRRRK